MIHRKIIFTAVAVFTTARKNARIIKILPFGKFIPGKFLYPTIRKS